MSLTYKQLKEFIEEMEDKDQEQAALVSCDGGWYELSAITVLAAVQEAPEGDEQYPIGQVILEV